jgi:hypothetical protein
VKLNIFLATEQKREGKSLKQNVVELYAPLEKPATKQTESALCESH